MGYQDIGKLPLPVVRSYLEPLIGTKDLARQYQCWIASLRNRDLAAVEPALRRLTMPTLIVWSTGDIFFRPRYAHWLRDTTPGVTDEVVGRGEYLPGLGRDVHAGRGRPVGAAVRSGRHLGTCQPSGDRGRAGPCGHGRAAVLGCPDDR